MFIASFMFTAISPLGISIYSLPLYNCFYLFANICPNHLFLAEQTTDSSNAPTFFSCVIIPTPFPCRARPGGAILTTQKRGAQSFARLTEREKDSIPDVNSQIKSQLTLIHRWITVPKDPLLQECKIMEIPSLERFGSPSPAPGTAAQTLSSPPFMTTIIYQLSQAKQLKLGCCCCSS